MMITLCRNKLLILLFYCFSPVAYGVEPTILSIDGAFNEGQILTIKGSSFTNKPNAKPLLYWHANGGELPSSLGRKSSWDGKFHGDIVDASVNGSVIAEGSTKAARIDYSINSGALLGKISFDTDKFYLWRKRYDDFDMLEDRALRTRYKNLTSINSSYSAPAVGMIVSTVDKSVYGRVVQVADVSGNNGTVYYDKNFGNFSDKTLVRSLIKLGTELVYYAESDVDMKTPILRAESNEGEGVYIGLNHKIVRIWADYGKLPDSIHISLDQGGAFHSYTFPTFWRSQWLNRIEPATKRWVVEELEFKDSTIDKSDGKMMFWQNGVNAWEPEKTFMFRTAEKPNRFKDIFQTQVSNGAQPLSFEYFDSLYVDDSWHRVVICAEVTWFACTNREVQIPTAWSDSEIKVQVRLGALADAERLYVYVVNEHGEANAVGYSSCPKCPYPPQGQ